MSILGHLDAEQGARDGRAEDRGVAGVELVRGVRPDTAGYMLLPAYTFKQKQQIVRVNFLRHRYSEALMPSAPSGSTAVLPVRERFRLYGGYLSLSAVVVPLRPRADARLASLLNEDGALMRIEVAVSMLRATGSEAGAHLPMERGYLTAYSFTGTAERRSELP